MGAVSLVLALVSLCVWTASTYAAESAASNPVVHTDNGDVRGSAFSDHREFLGIPFAAPPVGELRFAPPSPAPPWAGVLDATGTKSSCPQLPQPLGGMPSDNEDCLYLNIYTPAKIAGPRPVFFWIHGGGFYYGSGSSRLYNGARLAQQGNVIVVTINYRLNVFGFLASSALSKANQVSGNYGFEDQQAALQWVQRNIASFGGDPGKVTIAGESAGAHSVADHLLSPKSKGLFRAAIGESTIGIGTGLFDIPTLAAAEKRGDQYVADVGCGKEADQIKCLRSLSVEALLAKSRPQRGTLDLRWAPVLDGVTLTQTAAGAFPSGQYTQVPILNGTNQTESQLFLAALIRGGPVDKTNPFDADGYADRVSYLFGDGAPQVLKTYPANSYNSPLDAWSAILTDSGWACSGSRAVQALAARVPTYQYEFRQADAAASFPKIPGFTWQDPHAVELPYVFGNFIFSSDDTRAHRALSDRIIGYWTNFATTLNPNQGATANLPNWLAYQTGSDHVLSLADNTAASQDFRKQHNCDLWDSIYAASRH
jgi:para-nitrobenzyl esterase